MKRNALFFVLVSAILIGLSFGFVLKRKDSHEYFNPMVTTAEASRIFYCGEVLSEIHELAVDINYKDTDEKRLDGQELRQEIIACMINRRLPVSEEKIRSYIVLYGH